jgi:hypothetical protein
MGTKGGGKATAIELELELELELEVRARSHFGRFLAQNSSSTNASPRNEGI